MVCPYCSTDMEPIELSGKVFCSNCGLTIKNNQPAQVNTVSQSFQKVEDVATERPEELQFPVVPEIADALEHKTENSPDILIPSSDDSVETASNVPAEPFNPITQAAAEELGLETPAPDTENGSRIPDISIPTEADFDSVETRGTSEGSFIELASPGNETDILNASNILLDILSEEPEKKPANTEKTTGPRKLKVDVLKDKPQNPIENPELEPAEKDTPSDEIDPKTAKKIEKLEEKIEEIPEPEVTISPEEAKKYDPDTIKSAAIKEYFNSALSEARNQPRNEVKKNKKKVTKKKAREHGPALIFAITLAGVTAVLLGFVTYYLITNYVGL